MRGALILVLIGGCHSGLPGGATLSGRVIVGDESDLAGLIVHADGLTSATTTTDHDGRYHFDLPFGDFTVSATVRSTVEATRSLSITVDRSLDAPDLRFTPAGGLEGRVTRGGKMIGNAGILVSVDGTSGVGVSDDSGGYQIDLVPVGSYTVRAQTQGFRAGSVDGQQVRWGEITEVPELDLVIAPGHAALRGTALLYGRDDHSGTAVEVVGTGLATTTAADGSWAIDGVPEGTWALHFKNGSIEETVSQVEALVGSDGFVIDEALYPLSQSPLTLFGARRIASLQFGQSFQLSPDGTRVLYAGPVGTTYGLEAVTLDGQSATLTSPFFSQSPSAFAPDGQSVGFVNGNQLFTVPAAGGTPLSILRGVTGFQYSPDSAQLAWFGPDPVTGERSFGVIAASGGMSRHLVTDGNLYSVNWNRQGTRFLVYSYDLSNHLGPVKLVPADGSAASTVAGGANPPLVRADKRWALVLANVDYSAGSSGDVVAIDLEAGRATTLASSSIYYGFAGDRVVYKTNSTLYSAPLAGGAAAMLGNLGSYAQVMISDDGSTVAFSSDCTPDGCNLWKVPAAGTMAEPLGVQRGSFTLAPDGSAVVYATDLDVNGVGTLWVGGDGQAPRSIDSGVYGFGPPRFTADGTHVLYEKDVVNQSSAPYATLYLAPSAGGTPVKLAENASFDFVGSPDGKKWAITRHPPTGEQILVVAPADGSAATPILDGLVTAAWTSKSALVALRSGGAAPYRFQNGLYVLQ